MIPFLVCLVGAGFKPALTEMEMFIAPSNNKVSRKNAKTLKKKCEAVASGGFGLRYGARCAPYVLVFFANPRFFLKADR